MNEWISPREIVSDLLLLPARVGHEEEAALFYVDKSAVGDR